MKIVFFGTPHFAAKILDYLCKQGVNVAAVVSKPDKPKGRSNKPVPTPVRLVAEERGLPLLQPEKVSTEECAEQLRRYDADLFVVVAYGEIISQSILDIPRLACINIHASLLPKYRGAAPIQTAIIEGEEETGITIIHMARKMDAGDIIKAEKVAIAPNETCGDLEVKLCELACRLVFDVIQDFAQGVEERTPQDESMVTFAPKIELEDCEIDWLWSAQDIHNLIRGVNPYPGAWCFAYFKGEEKRLKIFGSEVLKGESLPKALLEPGELLIDSKRGVIVGCGDGALSLQSLQLEGKKVMSGKEFASGLTPKSLTLFSEGSE